MDYDDSLELIAAAVEPGVFAAANIDHLSFSNLSLLDNCSEKWRQRYVLKRSTGKSFPMAVGNSVHRAVEYYHLGKTPEEAWEAARAKFRKELPQASDVEKTQADAAVERMYNAYSEKYPQQVVATEHEVDIGIGSGVTIKVVIDVVDELGVADIKSIARTREKFTPDELQLFFGLLARHVEGDTKHAAEIRPLRRDVTGQRSAVALEPFPFTATADWIKTQTEETVKRIKDAQARLKSELWDGPEDEKRWLCKYCDFQNDCPITTGPVQFVGSRL